MKHFSIFSLISLIIVISVPAHAKPKKKLLEASCKVPIQLKNVDKNGPLPQSGDSSR